MARSARNVDDRPARRKDGPAPSARSSRTAHPLGASSTAAPANSLAVGRAVARRLRAPLLASHLSDRPRDRLRHAPGVSSTTVAGQRLGLARSVAATRTPNGMTSRELLGCRPGSGRQLSSDGGSRLSESGGRPGSRTGLLGLSAEDGAQVVRGGRRQRFKKALGVEREDDGDRRDERLKREIQRLAGE